MSATIHVGQAWVVSLTTYEPEEACRVVAVCESYQVACEIADAYSAECTAPEATNDLRYAFSRIDPVPLFAKSTAEPREVGMSA